MPEAFDRVIQGDLVMSSEIVRNGWLAARGGIIAAYGQGSPPAARDVLDHSGRLILPGLVDGHMHTSSQLG